MANNKKSLPVLWNTKIKCVQQLIIYYIAKALQFINNNFKVSFVSIQKAAHIFKHENFRLQFFYCINEGWKTIPGIFNSFLISTNTERVAWWPANHNLCSEIFKGIVQFNSCTIALQIFAISFRRIGVHFIANSFITRSFKPKSKATAPCKKVNHNFLISNLRLQFLINQINIAHLFPASILLDHKNTKSFVYEASVMYTNYKEI